MAYTILKSSIFDEFRCIADKCKETCCKNWNIYIDKKSYNKVRHIRKCSPELKEKINTYIRRRKNPESDWDYAEIRLVGDEKYCPLYKQGLCSMQCEVGYTYLCNICQSFPRQSNYIQHLSLEKHLSTACEAVVDILMNKPEGIFMEIESENNTADVTASRIINTKDIDLNNNILSYYWDIKIMCLNILQNRLLSVDDRMIHLGFALKEISDAHESNDLSTIPAIIDKYNIQAKTDLLSDMLKDLEMHKEMPLTSNAIAFLGDRKLDKQIRKNFNITGNIENFTFEKKNYVNAYNKMMELPNFKEYILENFTVNTFLTEMVPFTFRVNNIFENFCCFAELYSLMKFALAGYMGDNPSLEKLQEAMMLFSRHYLHNQTGKLILSNILKDYKTNNLASIALMIKA